MVDRRSSVSSTRAAAVVMVSAKATCSGVSAGSERRVRSRKTPEMRPWSATGMASTLRTCTRSCCSAHRARASAKSGWVWTSATNTGRSVRTASWTSG